MAGAIFCRHPSISGDHGSLPGLKESQLALAEQRLLWLYRPTGMAVPVAVAAFVDIVCWSCALAVLLPSSIFLSDLLQFGIAFPGSPELLPPYLSQSSHRSCPAPLSLPCRRLKSTLLQEPSSPVQVILLDPSVLPGTDVAKPTKSVPFQQSEETRGKGENFSICDSVTPADSEDTPWWKTSKRFLYWKDSLPCCWLYGCCSPKPAVLNASYSFLNFASDCSQNVQGLLMGTEFVLCWCCTHSSLTAVSSQKSAQTDI